MASILDNGFRSNADQLKFLLGLLSEYNIFSEDISALSLVGLTTHALSDMNDATLYRSNQAIKESHVVTAQKLSSLHKHAREVEIFPRYAIPSKMKMVLIIQEKDFLKYATVEGDVAFYTISTDNFIKIGRASCRERV